MNFFIIFLCLSFSSLTYSREPQLNLKLLGTVKPNCVPKVEGPKCKYGGICGEEVSDNEADIYKCKIVLKSNYCLKRKTKSYKEKTKVKGVEKTVTKYKWRHWKAENEKNCLNKNYTVNIILNKEAVFSGQPVDLTYFLHGKVNNGLVDEKVRRRRGKQK